MTHLPRSVEFPCEHAEDVAMIFVNQGWTLDNLWFSALNEGQCAITAFPPAEIEQRNNRRTA